MIDYVVNECKLWVLGNFDYWCQSMVLALQSYW